MELYPRYGLNVMQCAPRSFKGGVGICFGCGGNVSAFCIQHDGDHRAKPDRLFVYGLNDLLESRPTLRTKSLKERSVGLERRGHTELSVSQGSGKNPVQLQRSVP